MLRLIFLVMLIAANSLGAADSEDIAILLKVKGSVEIKTSQQTNWEQAERGKHLNSGDVVRTGDDGFAAVVFTDDKSLMKVRANSTITINGKREKATVAKRLNLPVGEMWLKVKKQDSELKIETPTGIAAVKGTEFYTIVDKKGNTTLHGLQGIVALNNEHGKVTVKAGQTALATKKKPPTAHKSIKSEVPTWAHEDKTEYEIKIEFKNEKGNKKIMKIIYDSE